MKNKITKTTGANSVLDVTRTMGDDLVTKYDTTGDLRVGSMALAAYRTSLAVAKAQITYKKMTGAPATIDFFEK